MSWPFSKKSPKKSTKLTAEQEERRLKLKNTRLSHTIAHNEFLEMSKNDPNLKRQLVAQVFNLKLAEPLNPIEQKKKEIESKIVDQALEKITTSPELTQRFVDSQVEKIIGEAGISENEEGEFESPLQQAINQIREAKEFEREFGGGDKGFIKDLLDSEAGKELAKGLFSILGTRVQKVYIVETPEGTLEMNPLDYQRYLETTQRGQLPGPAAEPVEPKRPPTPRPPEEVQVEPEPVRASLGLSEWLPYLDQEPENFVAALFESANWPAEQSQFIIGILISKTADEILEMLEPFKSNEEYIEVIEKLEEKKAWLEQVVSQVRMVMGEGI